MALRRCAYAVTAVVTIAVLLAACGTEVTPPDRELEALAVTFGRTVELVGDPLDHTDSLDRDAVDDGVIGEVRGSTRHGRVRLRRYEYWNLRESAQRALPPQGEHHNGGFTAHAGCQDILFEFRGYDDATKAVRHALVAIQMLEFSADGVCQRGDAPPVDTAPTPTQPPAPTQPLVTSAPPPLSVDDQFVAFVRSEAPAGTLDDAPDSFIIDAGHLVCNGYDSGLTDDEVMDILFESAETSDQLDAFVVVLAAAITYYCPEHSLQ